LGLEVVAELDVKVSLVTEVETKGHIMVERDGYIPHSVAALAINEFCIILGGKLGLDNGVGEALMASRVDMIKAVDQRPELQHLVEQLVFRIVNYFTDQDCDCM